MKEARIIFPVNGNGHKEQEWIDQLVKKFGGAAIFPGFGHWIDPNGMRVDEPVRVVDVAYEPSEANDYQLFDIAQGYLKTCQENEVYLRYGNGTVQMVRASSEMDNGHSNMEYDPGFGGVIKAVTDLSDEGLPSEQRVAAFEYLEQSLINHKEGRKQ